MATIQYERDLRAAQKANKRYKDSVVKWSYGVRQLPGVRGESPDGKVRPVLRGSSWTVGSSWKPVPVQNRPPLPVPDNEDAAARERRRFREDLMSLEDDLAFAPPDEGDAPAARYQPAVVGSGSSSGRRGNRKTHASKLPSSRVPDEMDLDAACSEMDLLGSPRRSSGQGTVLSIPAAASETAVACARGILEGGPDHSDAPAPVLSLGAFAQAANVRATEKLVKKEYEVLDTNGDAVRGRKARRVLRQEAAAAPPVPLDDEEFELV